MLYIFHVDTGHMMKFDMNMALESVQSLKDTIERLHGLPTNHQVLLISGGEILQDGSRVCSYSSGTDTNPIYMFNTSFVELKNAHPPGPSIEPDDFKEQVKRSLNLPANYSTVYNRAQLAQKIHERAKEEIKICETLVYEQHLQQQGWAAVIANMEDLTDEFRQRCEDFYRSFDQHLSRQTEYNEFLSSFSEDLEKLSRIPILPGLMSDASQGFHGFDDIYEENESSSAADSTERPSSRSRLNSEQLDTEEPSNDEMEISEQQKARGLTLLNWISAKENQATLQSMAESCVKGLKKIDQEVITSLKTNVENIISSATMEDIKEVKGLKSRLEGLDRLMFEAKKKTQDQNELATAFQQNQIRANNLGDASILPDLCESHSSQLNVMLKNHLDIRDIRRRVSTAKEELGVNLMQRLKFIVQIENRMSDLDNQLLFYHRCLRRVQRHLIIIEQIHHAPSMYVTAVTEVVRRRQFSTNFLIWASDLASRLVSIYDEEVMRRQDFCASFEGHFLNSLFSGTNDMPPTYAIQAPSIFDSGLPNLTQNDLDVLSTCLPEVTSKIPLPDLSAVIQFFMQTSGNSIQTGKDKNPLEKNVKDGCDSETDTEEFEQVGQIERRQVSTSTTDVTQPPETASMSTSTLEIATRHVETITEENLGSTRLEVERLRGLLHSMHSVCRNAVGLLREQLSNIKKDSDSGKQALEHQFEKIAETWDKIKDEAQNREREAINRLTVDHELELNDIKKYLNTKVEEIDALTSDKSRLEEMHKRLVAEHDKDKEDLRKSIDEMTNRIAEMEAQANQVLADKQKAVNEIRDKLHREHKTEIESLRCRFKLMATMDRSPSETSLEKIERPDAIEIHGSIPKFSFGTSSPKSPTSSQDMFKRILDEKERQLDTMRERMDVLARENMRYKGTIQNLADSDETGKQMSMLRAQLDAMQLEKQKLENELKAERSRRDMEASVTVDRSVLTTSTRELVSPSSSSSSRLRSYCQRHFICIDSCTRGDHVLIVWNGSHRQFTIVQDNPVLFFLHADSHEALNLTVPPEREPPLCHALGIVTDKEYCHAKKNENRYKVSVGTKFYRVKVRPRSPAKCEGKCCPKRERHDTEKSHQQQQQQPAIVASAIPQNLIDSFAQTDAVDNANRDMVDSGLSIHTRGSYKERNISITEEDEPISLSYERPHYISVTEEEEKPSGSQRNEIGCFISSLYHWEINGSKQLRKKRKL
ncbi:RB1-inducible coiled-coil protein 1 isoform X2 [Bradysia coprophila]|uniref:RB1-inducible coiled-coil protein 1 isoform X2 n=1 Tax=Bradysia coprophila TaxID=38358 RepID=UPI00187DACBD|nr:RB1-inducible coiled-coil protein 1 isoform X2 [Bradysia coprophila]